MDNGYPWGPITGKCFRNWKTSYDDGLHFSGLWWQHFCLCYNFIYIFHFNTDTPFLELLLCLLLWSRELILITQCLDSLNSLNPWVLKSFLGWQKVARLGEVFSRYEVTRERMKLPLRSNALFRFQNLPKKRKVVKYIFFLSVDLVAFAKWS